MNRIRHLIFYLNEHGITEHDAVDAEILSEYIRTFINYSCKSVAANLVAIRCFLRYLYLNGYTVQNLSEHCQRLKITIHLVSPKFGILQMSKRYYPA